MASCRSLLTFFIAMVQGPAIFLLDSSRGLPVNIPDLVSSLLQFLSTHLSLMLPPEWSFQTKSVLLGSVLLIKTFAQNRSPLAFYTKPFPAQKYLAFQPCVLPLPLLHEHLISRTRSLSSIFQYEPPYPLNASSANWLSHKRLHKTTCVVLLTHQPPPTSHLVNS